MGIDLAQDEQKHDLNEADAGAENGVQTEPSVGLKTSPATTRSVSPGHPKRSLGANVSGLAVELVCTLVGWL